MELKNYQQKVIDDLSSYLSFVNKDNNVFLAWKDYWAEKDISVGLGGVPSYNNAIKAVPHVCMKVPTGGGKTYLACAALKRIINEMPNDKPKVVVWLVPSDSILTQTLRNLSNPSHPYRNRIDRDFAKRVEIYSKEQLLHGQNFSPDTVREVLSVCILSYSSIRIDKTKADSRKIYQENGNLQRFADYFNNKELLLADTPESALIQVLRQLSPVVVVDESHNAKSDLSIEMLNNLNPSFVLDLTATPRNNSNIISYVDARELKKEHMVKLPVVVFNRNSRQSVIQDAIQLRGCLEQQAKHESSPEGKAVRPIVLFQAQPKTSSDSETFESLKNKLLEIGIPEEQIGIKTSKVDTISKLDLLSPQCPIRYIITVNALKEGWDCPYAYILASLANKTSKVDVEQILGRILRQPSTKRYESQHLNTSYVLTCSADFYSTLDNIVAGLNLAGFSKKDYRVVETQEQPANSEPVQPNLPESNANASPTEDKFDDIDSANITLENESAENNPSLNSMIQSAAFQAQAYEQEVNNTENDVFEIGELGKMLNQITIQDQFKEEIRNLKIPQFYLHTENAFLGNVDDDILYPESLSEGLSLKDYDTNIKFELAYSDVYEVDLSERGEAIPKYRKTDTQVSEELRKYFETLPSDTRIRQCCDWICNRLNKRNTLKQDEIREYVRRIISGMTSDEIEAMETSIVTYANKIEKKIDGIESQYRERKFKEWLDTGKIICKESYSFPPVITPSETIDSIPKSLYTAERNDMNSFEKKLINSVVALKNVVWWHRIIDRKGFCINGFINHYPDFVIKTVSGKIIFIEAKGDYLDGTDSLQKIHLGRKWQREAKGDYRYFMVFQNNDLNEDGAYTIDSFISVLKES